MTKLLTFDFFTSANNFENFENSENFGFFGITNYKKSIEDFDYFQNPFKFTQEPTKRCLWYRRLEFSLIKILGFFHVPGRAWVSDPNVNF